MSTPLNPRRCAVSTSIAGKGACGRVPRVSQNPTLSTAGTMRYGNQPHRRGVCTGALRLTGPFQYDAESRTAISLLREPIYLGAVVLW
jgi:hypothetical protein